MADCLATNRSPHRLSAPTSALPKKLSSFFNGSGSGGCISGDHDRLELTSLSKEQMASALQQLRSAASSVWMLEYSQATQLRPETTANGKPKQSIPTALLILPFAKSTSADNSPTPLCPGKLMSLDLEGRVHEDVYCCLQTVLEGIAPIEAFDVYTICTTLFNLLPPSLINPSEWHMFRDAKVAAWLLDSSRSYPGFAQVASLCGQALARRSEFPGTTGHLFSASYLKQDMQVLKLVLDALQQLLRDNGLADIFWNLEMPVLPLLAKMGAVGVGVDPSELRRHQDLLNRKLSALEEACHAVVGYKFLVSSPTQLRVILYEGNE